MHVHVLLTHHPRVTRCDVGLFPGAEGYARDVDDEWLKAQCIKIDHTHWEEVMAKIHYDGWGTKFDEWLPLG